MSAKPHILITNDDGIHAKGIYHLWNALKDHAIVTVVAPDKQQSGSAAAITIHSPLNLQRLSWNAADAWQVSGTPADCVRLSLSLLLDQEPDLIVSGINRGGNHGSALWYSGTVGSLIEGALKGVPGIAFSCVDYMHSNYEAAEPYIWPIVKHSLEHPFPQGNILNVNFPEDSAPRGVKLARQGKGYWTEEKLKRSQELEDNYRILHTPSWRHFDEHEESDVALLRQGFVTVVPVKIQELTDHDFLEERKAHFDLMFH